MAEFKIAMGKFRGMMDAIWGEPLYLEEKVFEKLGATIVEADGSSADSFLADAADADALMIHGGGVSIDRNVIASLKKCKIIALPTVGFDNIDISAATEHGIWVTNTPDVFIEEVADHAMTLLLGCWRHIIVQDRLVRTGRWMEARPLWNRHPRLFGTTLGFVGFGNIPRAVSKRVMPFGIHMLAYDPYCSELDIVDYGVEPVTDFGELLARSDYVSAHLPSSSETDRMISEAEFKQMKESAIFLNTGRGATVDEAALIKALKEGWIAGAGLDVFEKEPIEPDNPLIEMDNVILTAHGASASSRMPVEARKRAALEITRVLRGMSPMNPVNDIGD